MKNLFSKYYELTNLVNKAKNDRIKQVNLIVENLQKKTDKGYIEFDDETSYPIFYDETIDENEAIVGAKVVDGTLYITTDSTFNTLSWFNWVNYGKMDLDEFIYILENSLA